MAQKEIIVQGATCECQFGNSPDKLKVLTQQKHYANDKDGSSKLIATDKDIGMTFEKNTFGKCKLKPYSGGYRPCVPALQQWVGMYENTVLSNQGKILLEDSKGICSVSGSPCIKFTHTGQKAEPSQQNLDNADEDLITQVTPLMEIGGGKVNPYNNMKFS